MGSAALRRLERRIEEAGFRPRRAGMEAASTGIPQLDALLPRGGLPRGRTVEWLGPRSCGKTAVLRTALRRLHADGEPVAIVDATRSLYAPDWVGMPGRGAFWVVRPGREEEAPWCADLLLRSGAFGAVALEGDEVPGRGDGGRGRPLSRSTAVRLQRLAEEAGAVFVVMGGAPLAALRLRFRPGRLEPLSGPPFGAALPAVRPVWVALGEGASCEVPILCPSPPDRVRRAPTRDRKGRR